MKLEELMISLRMFEMYLTRRKKKGTTSLNHKMPLNTNYNIVLRMAGNKRINFRERGGYDYVQVEYSNVLMNIQSCTYKKLE